MLNLYIIIFSAFIITSYILILVAFFTILERKIIGFVQRRLGPNKVGPFGLFQPFADAIKLILKTTIWPKNSNIIIFIVAPILTFTLSFLSWAVVPFNQNCCLFQSNINSLYILAFSSMSLYGLIMGGWASNSKYAFFGAVRAIAQMISYEASFGLLIMSIAACSGTFDLTGIVNSQSFCWYIFPHLPLFVLFFISALAETNRHPFDFAEAESELVSGYNTEYGGILFVLYFLAEYSSILLMSTFSVILFFGGWLDPTGIFGNGIVIFTIKILLILSLFIIIRATYPRMRYDQLMLFCWKSILPLSLAWYIFTIIMLFMLDACPPIGGCGPGLSLNFEDFDYFYPKFEDLNYFYPNLQDDNNS